MVTQPQQRLLPVETILAVVPACFDGWVSYAHLMARPPTRASVRRVERELPIRLPTLLLAIARASRSYGYWFNSLGNDYADGGHILATNAALRAAGLDGRYVVFAQGFDGEYDAWDLGAAAALPEPPIVWFAIDPEAPEEEQARAARSAAPRPLFATFHEYVDDYCRRGVANCPRSDLRAPALALVRAADALPKT